MDCRLDSLVEFPTLQFAEFPKANSAEIYRWWKIGILATALYPHVTDVTVSLADLASFQEQSSWEFVFIFNENRHGCDFQKRKPKIRPVVTGGCRRFFRVVRLGRRGHRV